MSPIDAEVKSTLCDTLGNSSTLVIFAVLLIVCLAILKLDPAMAEKVVGNALTGLFGIAVGKSLK